jgi:hypothetical protein
MSEQVVFYTNPVFWLLITEIASVFVIPIVVIWYLFIHKILICWIMIPKGKAYQVLKKLKKPPETQTFDFRNGTYTVNPDEIVPERTSRSSIFYEFGNFNPLSFRSFKGNAVLAKTLFKNEALGRLLGRYREKILLIIICGLAIGLIVLSIYYQYQVGQTNDKWIALIANMTASKPTNATTGVVIK